MLLYSFFCVNIVEMRYGILSTAFLLLRGVTVWHRDHYRYDSKSQYSGYRGGSAALYKERSPDGDKFRPINSLIDVLTASRMTGVWNELETYKLMGVGLPL